MIRTYWNEKWKEVKFKKDALQKRYAVSNYGRIISFIDKIEDGDFLRGGMLRGYHTLPLRPFGKSKTFYIHKLVAELFLKKTSDDQQYVIHLDHNKTNNFVKNLRWASKDEMFAHQQTNPLVKEAREKQSYHESFVGCTAAKLEFAQM